MPKKQYFVKLTEEGLSGMLFLNKTTITGNIR